jgi:hypothetical protein
MKKDNKIYHLDEYESFKSLERDRGVSLVKFFGVMTLLFLGLVGVLMSVKAASDLAEKYFPMPNTTKLEDK